MNNKIIFVFGIFLLVFVGCNKNKDKNNLKNKEYLKGGWDLVHSEISVDSNDSETSSKIASNMESEMSVLKASLIFEDTDQFIVKSKLDSIELKKNGKYTIEDDNITFSFIAPDESLINFTYKFAVNQDSLYIIFDNLEEIQEILNNKTYSDSNLRLMYGVKDRNNIVLKSAQVKRIYTREKEETLNNSNNNAAIKTNDSIKTN